MINISAFLQVAKNLHLTLNESKSIMSVTEANLVGYCVSHKCIRPDPERPRPLLNLLAPI